MLMASAVTRSIKTGSAHSGTHSRGKCFWGRHSGGSMRVSRGILGFTISLIIAPVGIGFAHGGGSMGGGGTSGSMAGSPSRPEDMAKAAYNSGGNSLKKAKG